MKDSTKGGVYQWGDHSISMPRDWSKLPASKLPHKWKGTFLHETGHAIDMQGVGPGDDFSKARSIGLKAAILEDRKRSGDEPPFRQMTDQEDAQLRVVAGDAYDVAKDALIRGDGDSAAAAIQGDVQRVGKTSSPRLLDWYTAGNLRDFLGAVTRLKRGSGHSQEYYAELQGMYDLGDGIGIGEVAEAWANGFQMHVVENNAIYSYIAEVMAPNTTRELRRLIKEVPNGS